MARVTVEDSLASVEEGIFYMVRLAAFRAHQLQHGATPKIINRRGEKGLPDAPTVLALREIAAGFTDFDNEKISSLDPFGREIEEENQRVENK